MAPVNISGVNVTVNMIWIRCGGTSVPKVRPSAAPTSAPAASTPITGSSVDSGQVTPRISMPTGMSTRPAKRPRIPPKTIFSKATSGVDIGDSSRSSISRVKEKSITMGSAVFSSPIRNALSAMMPGSSTLPKSSLAYPRSLSTLPKINSMNSGWRKTCARKAPTSRVVTNMSRQSTARKVVSWSRRRTGGGAVTAGTAGAAGAVTVTEVPFRSGG